MSIFRLRALIFRCFAMSAADGEGGASGGGTGTETPATPSAPAAPAVSPAPAPVTPVSAPAPSTATPAPSPAPAEATPKSMLEAINRALGPDRGDGRDDTGRFVGKPGEKPPEAAPQVAAKTPEEQAAKPVAEAPKVPAEEMPADASPKAQERIRELANTNRELTQKFEQAERQVNYVRETFQKHGIQQSQFEQAVHFIGAVNRGDISAAESLLKQQVKQFQLMTGRSVTADALSDFPDLRHSVDAMETTEQRALEVARARAMDLHQQRQAEQQHAQQQQAQAQQQATQQGIQEVDAFCKQMAASDVDYPALEARLLPKINDLCQGLPPSAWKRVIATTYQSMKDSAAAARSSVAAASVNPLRPTQSAPTQQKPTSMYDAMFPRA